MKRPAASRSSGTGKKRSAEKPAVGSKFDKLQREIIIRSEADDWQLAKTEWALAHVYRVEWSDPGTCLCTHHPILEICTLENENTGHEAVVGNCCVKKFMDLPSETIFSAVRRVNQDCSKSLNTETLEFAYERGWITDWDHEFYLDTFRKRNTSDGQQEQRERINKKVIARMTRPAHADDDEVAWGVTESDIEQARAAGRITAWEELFYLGNMGRGFVTEKQLPIKERIEAKVDGTWKGEAGDVRWTFNKESIAQARSSGLISERDAEFYTEKLGCSSLSDKQQAWKERVEAKVNGTWKGEPGDVSWTFDSESIVQARSRGLISERDAEFYTEKLGYSSLSEKQQAWKERIEQKLREPSEKDRCEAEASSVIWTYGSEAIAQARAAGSITECDANFYVEKLSWRSLSGKQRAWKESIEQKIATTTVSTNGQVSAQAITAEQKARIASNRLAALERKWRLQDARSAAKEGKLTTWEIGFYEDVFLKVVEGRLLSDKQCLHRDRILKKLVSSSM